MAHYRRFDYRVESLNQIIIGLNTSIKSLQKKMEEENWYDGIWFLEEAEPVYGLAFIAFQNYIIGSIKDFSTNTNNKVNYYKKEPNLIGFERSSIELIIGLANYFKHKDDKVLHDHTRLILESFNLKYDNETFIDETPIFMGLAILNDKWNLFDVFKIVINWRENLWNEES
ncbi:MAG: hypothetical protein V5804_03365 [Mucilaginibacter sp.]|uniref:hypothetical protein n=1 Tax=Mucilaginibacter sp. TaxID=1882438 RepID=UPI0034E607C3